MQSRFFPQNKPTWLPLLKYIRRKNLNSPRSWLCSQNTKSHTQWGAVIKCNTCHRHVQPAVLNAEWENMNYFCKATNWLWRFPVKPQPNDPLLMACQASARLRRAWSFFFSVFTGCLLNKFVWECRELSPEFYSWIENRFLKPFVNSVYEVKE